MSDVADERVCRLPTLGARRRDAIVRLLETSTENLPEASHRSQVAPGFVGGVDEKGKPIRWLACPDCLANEEKSSARKIYPKAVGVCETCGGRGVIPDTGPDPYSVNEKTSRYGLDGARHDAMHARDREIDALARQTRPAPTEEQLLEEANQFDFAWARARERMRQRFDYAVLDVALEELRAHDPIAYRALHAAYVYEWIRGKDADGNLLPPVGAVAAACDRGLAFLSPRLAAVELARGKALRAPGEPPEVKVGSGPLRPEAGATTKARRDEAMRRAAAEGASVEQLCARFGVSKSTVYAVVNSRAA